MGFWGDLFGGIADWDWKGILGTAADIGVPLLTGYLTSEAKREAYQPGVPSYGRTGYELYHPYGDPGIMEAKIRAQMGGPPARMPARDEFYDAMMKAQILKGMAPGMTLSQYLGLMDERYGPQLAKERELAAVQALEKVDPRFVGTHGQLGPVGARYVAEATLPLEQAKLKAIAAAPMEFEKIKIARDQAVNDAIKAGMAQNLSWAQIQTTVDKINAEYNITLTKMLMEANKQMAAGVGETRGGITAAQGPGKLDWLSGLPWEDWQGKLSDWLTKGTPTTTGAPGTTGLEGMPFLGVMPEPYFPSHPTPDYDIIP